MLAPCQLIALCYIGTSILVRISFFKTLPVKILIHIDLIITINNSIYIAYHTYPICPKYIFENNIQLLKNVGSPPASIYIVPPNVMNVKKNINTPKINPKPKYVPKDYQ